MIFGPDLIGKVLSGEKTVTRRHLPARYRVGRVYAVQPGRGKRHVGHIEVQGANIEPLAAITEEEARREGFVNVGDFMSYWRRLYGIAYPHEEVTRIAFRLAPPCADCEPIT